MSTLSSLIKAKHPALAEIDLDGPLSAAIDAARAAWPDLGIEDAHFVAHLADRLPDGDPASALARTHAADLYLACACLREVPQAIAAFERQYLKPIAAVVARIDASTDFIAEVHQRLLERILVGPSARIAEYTGAGPLGGWVRIAAVRTALNMRRDAIRSATPRGNIQPQRDPEADLINVQYRREVESAFRAAFSRLSSADREILRLYYVEGRKQEEVGRLLKIERSTANRRIGAARQFLLQETHRQLKLLVPSITTASRDGLFVALRSHIDLNLESLLRG